MALWHHALIEKGSERRLILLKGADGSMFVDLVAVAVWDGTERREGWFSISSQHRDGRGDDQVLRDVSQALEGAGWAFLAPFTPAPPPDPDAARAQMAAAEEFSAAIAHFMPFAAEIADRELAEQRGLAEHWEGMREGD